MDWSHSERVSEADGVSRGIGVRDGRDARRSDRRGLYATSTTPLQIKLAREKEKGETKVAFTHTHHKRTT